MSSGYLHVLRIRPFRDLWLGQAISQLGDSFYTLIFIFMVMHLTKNPMLTGFVAAVEWLPFLALGPYAGVLADRLDRRKILLVSDLASTAVLVLFGVLAYASRTPPLWSLFVAPLLLSCIRVFFMPAKGAAIPRLVPPEDLLPANGLSMMTQSLVPLAGLSFTATVLGALFEASPRVFLLWAVALNAASFLASAWFVAKLPAIVPEQTEEKHPLQDLKEGMGYVRTHHVLLVMVVVSFFMNLFVSPFYVIYMATNSAWFDGKPQTIAWFEFCFFLGMTAGSLVCGRMRIDRPGIANSAGLGIVGLTVAAMAWSRSVPLFCLWNVAAGLALPFASIPMNSYIQATTEDAFRGRVNSALSMVSAGVHPVGMALSGVMIQRIGLVASYLVMGLGMSGVAALAMLDRSLRNAKLPGVAALPAEVDKDAATADEGPVPVERI